MTTTPALSAKCVATTGDTFYKTIQDSNSKGGRRYNEGIGSNLFREAQFSSDGTTVVTQSEDQCLRTFVLPEDLLDATKQPHELSAYYTLPSSSSVYSYAPYPHFNLQDASTTVALVATKDLPVRLVNTLYPDITHASYPLINTTTEAYVSPNSLAWTRDGSHFLAGSKGLLSVFDSSYDGNGPVVQHKVALGKNERKRFGGPSSLTRGGIFTALGISGDGLLAAGTTNREVTIYANEGSGECMTSFSVAGAPASEHGMIAGNGVTQLTWDPDDRYLLVAERSSNGIHVYDMRNTLSRVSFLTGRNANTPQRLGISVVPAADGREVWAGGMDGCVRMWRNPGLLGGEQMPDEMLPLHKAPVASTIWHPTGAVLATCSGRRMNSLSPDRGEEDSTHAEIEEAPLDNTLKVWTI